MIRIEFDHDIRAATYHVQVVARNALEVLDEVRHLVRVHDAGGLRAGRSRQFLFLLDPPAQDCVESRGLQKDQGIQSVEDFRVVGCQSFVHVVPPPSVRIPRRLELVDGRFERGIRFRGAADAPALEHDKVDRAGDNGPGRLIGTVVGRLVEA